MVMDDSILRSGLKVARALGLGGLQPEVATGPTVEIDPAATAPADWMAMEGDGTLRRLSLDVGQVNAAFAALGDPRATAKPEDGPTRHAVHRDAGGAGVGACHRQGAVGSRTSRPI